MGEQIIGRLLPEWLNSNQHRVYPLDESTVGNGLPTSFLVDALFICSASVDITRLYIKSIVKNGTNIIIRLAGYVNKVSTDFGNVAIVPIDTAMGTNIPVELSGDNYKLSGSFVIGNAKSLDSTQSIFEFDEDSGLIFPGCVRNTENTLLGIKIDDVLYTGVVTLEAGDGIEFTVTENEEGTVITINSTAYTLPEENMEITTDEELVQEAVNLYGTPVRTICNVAPDASGNITLATPESGKDGEQYVTAVKAGDGAISLTIANDTTSLECEDDSAQFDSIMQSLNNLNDRAADQAEILSGLEDSVSNLALQVYRV